MRSFRGKKALVTGAASGIGRAIALALADEGACLWLVDIDAAALASAAREAEGRGADVVTTACDIADADRIAALADAVRSRWAGLDILVNSAGIVHYGATHLFTDEQWRRDLSVNLLAPIQLVRDLLPMLRGRDEAHVVNICSLFGLVPYRKLAAYQTSKFGLVGFTLALRGEYGGDDFGVTAVCPGLVETRLTSRIERVEPGKPPIRLPAFLCTSPDKVAARTLAAMRRNKGLVVVTPAARLCWWLMRLSPGLIDWLNREGWRRRGRNRPAAESAS